MTAAHAGVEPIFEADLPSEIYATAWAERSASKS